MNQVTDQPIPSGEELGAQGGQKTQEAPPRSDAIGRVLETLKSVVGSSTKAKFVFTLLAGSFAVFILVFIISLIRRPQGQQEVITIPPTPTPRPITPTPEPEQKREEIDNIIIDIGEFDLNQRDLQPPVVDLKIGL